MPARGALPGAVPSQHTAAAVLVAIVIVLVVTVIAAARWGETYDAEGTPDERESFLTASYYPSPCVLGSCGGSRAQDEPPPLGPSALSLRRGGCADGLDSCTFPRGAACGEPAPALIPSDELEYEHRNAGVANSQSLVYDPPVTSKVALQAGAAWWPATGLPPASERPQVRSDGSGVLDPNFPALGTYMQPRPRPPLCTAGLPKAGAEDASWRYYDGAYSSNYSRYY
jgi:hypothetical protein